MHRLLGDTQAAFKLLMETVREKEAAGEALEAQVETLRSEAHEARRQRDEAAAGLQVRGRGGEAVEAGGCSMAGWCSFVLVGVLECGGCVGTSCHSMAQVNSRMAVHLPAT